MNEGQRGGSMTGEQREQDTWLPALIPPLRHPTHTHTARMTWANAWSSSLAQPAYGRATCIARCTVLPVRVRQPTDSVTTNKHHVVSTPCTRAPAARSAAAQRAYTTPWRAVSSTITGHARRIRDWKRTPSGLSHRAVQMTTNGPWAEHRR